MDDRPDKDHDLHRLTDAIAAFLEHGTDRGDGSADATQFLDEHEELRDLLEPMLEAPEIQEDPSPADGRYVGDYRLVREIGRGGMGVVYEAIHVPLGRRVALKILPGHVSLSASQIERFRREAAAAAKLRHHAIVPIYDVGESDGTHYFSMGFVDGRNLAELREKPGEKPWEKGAILPGADSYVAEVVEVVARVGDALHYAHDNGVLHRDVKPHNILVGEDGIVRLVDFGLARDTEKHSISVSGEFAGTPYYASPEQIAGDKRLIDRRTDVFSLGVVLYELLTRERPFDGETSHQILESIRTKEPRPLRRMNPRIPHDLAVICHKALEKDPEKRYATAGDLAGDLRRFQRFEPIVAQPPGAISRLGKAMRRHKVGFSLAGLTALILVGTPILVWRNSVRLQERSEQHLRQTRSLLRGTLEALSMAEFRPGTEGEYVAKLEDLFGQYDRAIDGALSDPKLVYDGISVISRLAEAKSKSGEHADAIRIYGEAIRRMDGLHRKYPAEPKFRFGCATQRRMRALQYLRGAKLAAAEKDLSFAIRIFEEMDGDPTTTELDLHIPVELARAYADKAKLQRYQGTALTAVRASCEAALRHWNRPGAAIDEHLDLQRDRAFARVEYVAVLIRLEKTKPAKKELEVALRTLEAQRKILPHHPYVRRAVALANRQLAKLRRQARDLHGAADLLRQAIHEHSSLAEDFPHSIANVYNRVVAQSNFCELLIESKDHREEVWGVLAAALEGAESLLERAPDVFAYRRLHAKLTAVHAHTVPYRPGAKVKHAIAAFREAADLFRDLIEDGVQLEYLQCRLSHTLHYLGHWETRKGDLEQAEATLVEAVRAEEAALALNPKSRTHKLMLSLVKKTLASLREKIEAQK